LFKETYPADCIDVGIAEEHAAVMAAGMALGNLKAVLMMYSTFAQRSFDYLLNDITRQNLDVFLMLDRAGVVGKDGPTHQGIYDIAMLSLMPNIKIMMGRNAGEVKGLITYGMNQKGPIALRYPRLSTIDNEEVLIADEKWEVVKEGSKGYIISYGPDVDRILNIINENNLDLTLINARFIRPLDNELLIKIAKDNKPILIYEQVVASSSLAMMITYFFTSYKYNTSNINSMSFDTNQIVTHGDIMEVLDYYHLGDKDILERIKEIWKD
jgi:1-deoxy-D-xylulose-5-phosphate synthase